MAHDRAHRPDATGSESASGGGGRGAPEKGVGTYFLGRYRVVDEIGIGGMASVHLARMDGPGGFQKWIAIKRIHTHLVEDESFVQMFLDEARVAARISHPNVATVFELGKHEDSYWIAMEYLHGEPLREVMRRTEELGAPMPPEIACRVIADAAEGLHAAHELLGKNGEKLGLVHRDVTPHNLFVTYDGTTKVVDFGIAKFSSRMSSTRAGTLKGKLAYMSPEQVHGETIDRRTDIFALGVVLWELTTGQRLFRMESDLDTLAKVQECNVPRPSTLVRGYPIDLEKIVMKALAKNRGERFKTAREFSRALQSLLMRRGLFIASDEVASYIQSIFGDRIQKREAHLRWAAEVTQTISLDSALGTASMLDTGQMRAHQQQHAPPDPSQSRQAPAASGGRLAAPRPAAGAPPPVRGQAPSQGGGLGFMPPAAGAPARSGPPRPNMPSSPGGKVETFRPPARQQPADMLSTQETPVDDPYDDGPTIQGASPFDGEYPPPDEEFDDQDDTIVTMTKVEGNNATPGARGGPGPLPAAGRPANALADSGETRAAPGNKSNGNVAAAAGNPEGAFQLPPGFGPPPPAQGNPSAPGVNPFAQTQRLSGHVPLQNPDFGGAGMDPHAAMGASGETRPLTQPRFLAPGDFDNRTMTARALKRGMPMWAVAVASGLVALLLVGAIYALLSRGTPEATAPKKAGTTTTVTAAGTGTGPFGVARTAFTTAIAPSGPTGALAPTTTTATTPPAPATTVAAAAATTTAPAATAAPAPKADTPAPRAASTPAPRADTAAFGYLTVICKPAACEQVIDNGTSLGSSPLFRQKVPVGSHRLQFRSNGQTKVISVFIMADTLETKTVTFP